MTGNGLRNCEGGMLVQREHTSNVAEGDSLVKEHNIDCR